MHLRSPSARTTRCRLRAQVSVPAEGGLIFEATINGKGPFKAVFDTGSVNILSANSGPQAGA